MKTISLNGAWTLRGRSVTDPLLPPIEFSDATVPGMAQLELSRHGILPEDLYMGMNVKQTEAYEDWEWWYEREFDAPEEHDRAFLVFRGVDCYAEYFLNGEKFGESANAMIPFEFDVSERLRSGKNTLTVHLLASKDVRHRDRHDLFCLLNRGTFAPRGPQNLYERRPAHSYGWDIMPRLITSGLWRDVALELRDPIRFTQLYISTRTKGQITLAFETESRLADFRDVEIEFEAVCRDSRYYSRFPIIYQAGAFDIEAPDPYLWWPYGYGDADLYRATVRIYSEGRLVHETRTRFAFRTVELDRTDSTDGVHGRFRFLINGEEIMAKGSNWVPLDALHCRDRERYADALALVKDLGCNILRCWGGNVYEDHEFFDFCDENGVMVWQDFSMACANYPCDERFEAIIREEATAVIREYRRHPSIILWSGDNEVDSCVYYKRTNTPPSHNTITRKLLPYVVERNDDSRPYLISSPYYSDEVAMEGYKPSEEHLWGARDYYKSLYYLANPAHFVSECGYYGCPDPESIKRFITPEKVWSCFDNEEWTLHSTDPFDRSHRTLAMYKQVRQLFGEVPDDLETYSLASQISQAEAVKFLIERMRVDRPNKSGIIWWNVLDGWPQMSDAVVDYYFTKKLAYDYIKRAQAPFTVAASELGNWKLRLHACNDTLTEKRGHLRVYDIETDETLAELDLTAAANTSTELVGLEIYYSEQRFLVFEWEVDGKKGFNHYLCGYPAFSLERYRAWLRKYQERTGFCAWKTV